MNSGDADRSAAMVSPWQLPWRTHNLLAAFMAPPLTHTKAEENT